MTEEQADLTLQTIEAKPSRPALVVSRRTLSEYSMLLQRLLVGFAVDSISVALVCPPDCDVDSIVSPAVEVIRHPFINLPLMGHQNRKILIERLEKFRPTVVHCLCQSMAVLTRRLARHLDLPYILTINSLQKRRGQFSISHRRCAKVIVPAKSIAENFTGLYPRFAERIAHINIGTFTAEESRCFSDPSRLPCMVTAHLFKNAADFEKLFSAVRHLAIERYEFMLVVIGSGRAETQLRKLLTALGLSQIVTIVPRVTPWDAFLAAADIFIRPRPTNTFDPLLLEAMGGGSAVAACKGGVDDLIIEDQTCAVFDPDDELSIMGSLQRLLDRREFARQLAQHARQLLQENHSVSKMTSSILGACRDAEQWYRDQQ